LEVLVTTAAIETRDLSRRFGQHLAVDSVNMRVPEGVVYGFLGRNGAGKTTTLKMILALLRPTRGGIRVCGRDVRTHRREAAALIGSLLEAHGFHQNLTGYQNLDLTRRLLGLPRTAIDRALEITSMRESAGRWVDGYSLGMRQRLGIARALLNSPRLLLLDEPTNGLDPDGICDMRIFLRTLPERTGATVIVSSHLLGEVEMTAGHIGILHRGQLVTEGPLERLQAELPVRIRIEVSDADRAAALAQSRGFETSRGEGGIAVGLDALDDPREAAGALNRALVEAGLDVWAIKPEPRSLESVYRRVTGMPADSGAA
jgi:ABC-2 type transport system ATP-binding protein